MSKLHCVCVMCLCVLEGVKARWRSRWKNTKTDCHMLHLSALWEWCRINVFVSVWLLLHLFSRAEFARKKKPLINEPKWNMMVFIMQGNEGENTHKHKICVSKLDSRLNLSTFQNKRKKHWLTSEMAQVWNSFKKTGFQCGEERETN